ncbi:hypothetical protein [Streptomyces bungoensis]|nr:hypothetical protein [Streptomyces bungoensis]
MNADEQICPAAPKRPVRERRARALLGDWLATTSARPGCCALAVGPASAARELARTGKQVRHRHSATDIPQGLRYCLVTVVGALETVSPSRRAAVLGSAADAVAPGGRLLIVAATALRMRFPALGWVDPQELLPLAHAGLRLACFEDLWDDTSSGCGWRWTRAHGAEPPARAWTMDR